jgi:hypothetical protein
MANDDHPLKEIKNCVMCIESKVSDAKDDEDEEMGDDDEEPMKMCCMIPEGGYTLFEIEKEE